MGFKTIKDHFNIQHQVQVRDGNILIGSPYIGDIIVISPEGKLLKTYSDSDRWSRNDDLVRYDEELKEAEKSGLLLTLVKQKDKFNKLYRCYTFKNGKVLEKFCEEYGWPNLTTEGEIMYENTFFQTEKEAREANLKDTRSAVICYWRMLKDGYEQSFGRIRKVTRLFAREVKFFFIARIMSN